MKLTETAKELNDVFYKEVQDQHEKWVLSGKPKIEQLFFYGWNSVAKYIEIHFVRKTGTSKQFVAAKGQGAIV